MTRPAMAAEQAALSLAVESDGVAWLVMDNRSSRPNLLTGEVLGLLDGLLGEVAAAAAAGRIRALVVRSGKDGSFCAGADVHEIGAIPDEAAGEAAAATGQRVFLRLDRLPVPAVAAIDGACMGGATELALACDYRLASDRPETRIGLPEVRLGIIPGFGGTTRLPRLLGIRAALELILTGRSLDAVRAQRLGLVHERVAPADLCGRARAVALALAAGSPLRVVRRGPMDRLLDGPGRGLLLAQARTRVLKQTRGHYPAPLAALDVIGRSAGRSLEQALAIEARAVGRLLVTVECRNLVHVYRLLDRARKAGPPGVAARPVTRVAVLGAGVMGSGIVRLLVGSGIAASLEDLRPDRREPHLDRARLGAAELVIEAVSEEADIKRALLREAESLVGADCILASNTSSVSITGLQAALTRPGNCCGMNFFNPVDRMPLVEVVRGERTTDATVAAACALARALGKTPVVVRDGPGFLVNRILLPYLNEAGRLLAEGARVERIDEALMAYGMPMGPLRLLDEIGLDVALRAGLALADALGERLAPPPVFAALAGTGRPGRRGGLCFYRYHGDRRRGVDGAIYRALGVTRPGRPAPEADEIRDRTVLAMVNEAARVLADGIAGSPEEVDVAMIAGAGFPPFRGGLLRYADSLGTARVAAALEALAERHGSRFRPAPLLRELAAGGRGFYDG